MKREDLLQTLKLAAPALLSDSEVVLPILRSLKFTGSHVMASNDVAAVCLAVPVTTSGIVAGKKLISFLSACNSKSVKFTRTKKGNLTVKCASSKLLLSCHADEEWPFEFPDIEQAESLTVGETFFDAIELCASQSPDTGIGGWQGGITLAIGEALCVYGVGKSRATISFCRVEGTLPKRKTTKRVVVPSSFCKIAAAVAKECDGEATLHITDDSVVVEWGDGQNIVATKLMDLEMPDIIDRFNGIMEPIKSFMLINESLSFALKRAAMIGDKGTCYVTSEGTNLHLRARSDSGVVLNDVVKFSKYENVPPKVDCYVAADLICTRLDWCTEVYFGKEVSVLRSESGAFIYIVANRGEKGE